MSRFDRSQSWQKIEPMQGTRMRHNHEPFPITAPKNCPLCPQYLHGAHRPIGTTAERRLDGRAADEAARDC